MVISEEQSELSFFGGTTNNRFSYQIHHRCVWMLWQLYEPRVHGNCSLVSRIQYCRRNAIYISLFVLIFFFTIIFPQWLVLIWRVLSKHNFDVFIFLLRNSETSISTQYRNPQNIVLPQKFFLVIKALTNYVHNTKSKLRNKLLTIFFDENRAVFSLKITIKFLFWGT